MSFNSCMNMKWEEVSTQVLIIGAGGAGLRAALELEVHATECLIVTKRNYVDAHTRLAAGGINAALGNVHPEDHWQQHAADTMLEGHELGDPLAVEILTREAPERVLELAQWGCAFARLPDGRLNQRYFGAQTHPRTCFVGDCTGAAIMDTLIAQVRKAAIPWREHIFITKLLTQGERVCGAVGIDLKRQCFLLIKAQAIILASGGHTGLYQRSSSRADENMGDGMALALAAGCSLADMEMVQFHPTGMVAPSSMQGVLVSEAVRGEGGRLFNCEGERFMQHYSPERLELDARDVVARAIYQELREGRGTAQGGVLLNISHQDPDFIHQRLPLIQQQFQKQGVDITTSPMEVAPTAHYAMGGVQVSYPDCRSSLVNLFVVGEAASGVHGANRLGGNSLAETLVFGRRAARAAMLEYSDEGRGKAPELLQAHLRELQQLQANRGDFTPQECQARLGELLWLHAGIIRERESLQTGLRLLKELEESQHHLQLAGEQDSQVLQAALHFRMGLPIARAILESALRREESRGAHFRRDFPEKKDKWKGNLLFRPDGGLDFREVPAPRPELRSLLKKPDHIQYHHLE
jgi:succinate dehydrogenase / fumarate reductase, flavoprotein subunit